MSNYISTILNIDSTDRILYPKHVYELTNNFENKSILFTKDSNKLLFTLNDHKFSVNDNIVVNNVKGKEFNLINSIFLLNNSSYAIIKINNNIDIDYLKYINKMYINIKILNDNLNNYYKNIPFNVLTGIKQIYLYSDISNEIKNVIYNFILDIYDIDIFNNYYNENVQEINKEFILINTDIIYISNNNYDLFEGSIQLSFLDIYGIGISYINANYPINSDQYQNSHKISKIVDNNNFEIEINKLSYYTGYIYQKTIEIYKILDTHEGYEESNEYNIILNKTFNNVVNIELLSTEIPYVDIIIKKDINDKLFWKNLNDGNYIYNIVIPEGFYSLSELISLLQDLMNLVKRNSYSIENPVYNVFTITYNSNNFFIEFKSFENIKLSNTLFIKKYIIDNIEYYVITININNNLSVNDRVIIYNSVDIIFLEDMQYKILDKAYINKEHIVYSTNLNIEYTIIIGKTEDISISLYNNINNDISNNTLGGNIIISIPSKFSFLFDNSTTIGELLGFKNINTEFSITEFKHTLNNKYNFINNINLNSLGNEISYDNKFLNFSGKFNYILMYLNDIDYINNKYLQPCFAKILLPAKPGTIIFNTFVDIGNSNTSKILPINKLDELKILFLYPDGTKVNFRNLNHSFTIKITENVIIKR